MKKKGFWGLLAAVCAVVVLLCGVLAAEPDVITDLTPRPRAVVYDNTISATDSSFTTDRFTCTDGNGNSLRFRFRNDGEGECIIRLYQTGRFGPTELEKITVAPGAAASGVYGDPGGKTFYLTITCVTGGEINGQLRACQQNLGKKAARLAPMTELPGKYEKGSRRFGL